MKTWIVIALGFLIQNLVWAQDFEVTCVANQDANSAFFSAFNLKMTNDAFSSLLVYEPFIALSGEVQFRWVNTKQYDGLNQFMHYQIEGVYDSQDDFRLEWHGEARVGGNEVIDQMIISKDGHSAVVLESYYPSWDSGDSQIRRSEYICHLGSKAYPGSVKNITLQK